MTQKPKSAFEQALDVGVANKTTPQTTPRIQDEGEDRGNSLAGRSLKSRAQTKPFSHRVNIETVDGFYQIAKEQGWTMNQTLTKAYSLLNQNLSSEE